MAYQIRRPLIHGAYLTSGENKPRLKSAISNNPYIVTAKSTAYEDKTCNATGNYYKTDFTIFTADLVWGG